MKYIFTTARDKKTGIAKDSEAKYGGQSGYIANVSLDARLIFDFIDGNKRLITTKVEAYNSDWKTANRLIVQTENSVYVFEKELR
ncbi:hypothetical protein ACTJJR_01740 [Bacillus sp. 22266]|uniref:hypothetical protein n=1 Tax=Bacillus TaxID=1386 RepID=UPI000BA6B62A|nr:MULTISPECIES: hypothetical protein [Bacillus]MBS0046361.1 hypothetical protein [Bacillus velezensis]MCK6099061.1 hypothetical protein [Bacillus velezensis]MCK6200110.1 hypothetical protein [Bacillus velezensis]MCX2773098.1 hypothetical protein [Bacillus sp. H2FL2]PAC78573.1 hypothetical protein CHI11_06700 [Bacillus velezensis]